jgi:hypothetical protein
MPLFAMLTAVALLLPLPSRAPTSHTAAPRTDVIAVDAVPAVALDVDATNGEALDARVEIGPAVLTIYGASGKVVSVE